LKDLIVKEDMYLLPIWVRIKIALSKEQPLTYSELKEKLLEEQENRISLELYKVDDETFHANLKYVIDKRLAEKIKEDSPLKESKIYWDINTVEKEFIYLRDENPGKKITVSLDYLKKSISKGIYETEKEILEEAQRLSEKYNIKIGEKFEIKD
jgi:hypothetical protein